MAHLSLAPLTSKFPIGDEEELPTPTAHRMSYIEGRSVLLHAGFEVDFRIC